jgi:hypothetical protein
MNWTGCGVAFPREIWSEIRSRPELRRAGVYVLIGTKEDADLPTVYVGRAEIVASRVDAHVVEKDFWDRGVVFTSNSGGLNQAHAMWLEYSLIERAHSVNQCLLDNSNSGQKVFLSPADEADTRVFFKEVIQILPLLGVRAFEIRRPVAIPRSPPGNITQVDRAVSNAEAPLDHAVTLDTIVVPTGDPDDADGFNKYFIQENCWFPVRISGGMLDRIRYVAAYQSRPISAITHYVPVAAIEPYGEDGKYKLTFSTAAQKLDRQIPIGNSTTFRSPRYTTMHRLKVATSFADVFVERRE